MNCFWKGFNMCGTFMHYMLPSPLAIKSQRISLVETENATLHISVQRKEAFLIAFLLL
jgi:hypothetical protein